jgi:hypothetical protein
MLEIFNKLVAYTHQLHFYVFGLFLVVCSLLTKEIIRHPSLSHIPMYLVMPLPQLRKHPIRIH